MMYLSNVHNISFGYAIQYKHVLFFMGTIDFHYVLHLQHLVAKVGTTGQS